MQKLKSIIGYVWALASVPFILILLMSMPSLYQGLFETRGVKVTDRITGGKVTKIVQREGYAMHLHRPVFDGLFADRKSGFVQVDFISTANLPAIIEEEIDYDLDRKTDFDFTLDTGSNTYQLSPKTESVKSLSEEGVFVLEKRRTIRVLIEK